MVWVEGGADKSQIGKVWMERENGKRKMENGKNGGGLQVML
jgi:hypothetical protein